MRRAVLSCLTAFNLRRRFSEAIIRRPLLPAVLQVLSADAPASGSFWRPARAVRLVFASGWRLGLQKGFSEEGAVLTDRFYAGGGTTVRGFGQDELGPKLENGQPAGGNAVLVLNNELRFPLFWIFDGVIS